MVTKHMAHFGRVSVCGSIANYNDTEQQKCRVVVKIWFMYLKLIFISSSAN
jgi:NADPH-dependent curcumin reductase CurA